MPLRFAVAALPLLLSLPAAAAAQASFTLKGELEGVSGGVRQLAFSADGKRLLAADDSAMVTIFDVESRKSVRSFPSRHGFVGAMAVSLTSGLVATSGKDGFIRLWEPATGKLLREFKASGDPIFALAFDAGGGALASGGEDKTLRIHDPDTGILQLELKGHEDTIRSVAFADGGKNLMSCASDKTIRLWDVEKRREKRNQVERASEFGDLQGFAVSPAAGVFVTLARELKRAEGGIRTLGGRGAASNVVEDNVLILRDLASWDELGRLEGHLRTIHAAAFSPDGALLASVSDDQALLVWDRDARGKLVAYDLPDKQYAVAFSPDGKWLASGGDDKKVHLYAVSRPEKPRQVAEAPPKAAVLGDSKAMFDQGHREFNLGHFAEALTLFEEAYKQKPLPRLLYNIGQCHRLLGNLEPAKRVYRAFIAESPGDEPMVPIAQEKLAEIETALKAQTNARESAPSGLAQDKDKQASQPERKKK